jgi:hypothetical protein
MVSEVLDVNRVVADYRVHRPFDQAVMLEVSTENLQGFRLRPDAAEQLDEANLVLDAVRLERSLSQTHLLELFHHLPFLSVTDL